MGDKPIIDMIPPFVLEQPRVLHSWPYAGGDIGEVDGGQRTRAEDWVVRGLLAANVSSSPRPTCQLDR